MTLLKKYSLLVCSLVIGLLACQKGIDMAKVDNAEYKEYQNWLSKNGKIFDEEQIVLTNQNNNKIKGKLNWDQCN